MSSTTLFPPNSRQLSDDVIGQVIQRETPLRYAHNYVINPRTSLRVVKKANTALLNADLDLRANNLILHRGESVSTSAQSTGVSVGCKVPSFPTSMESKADRAFEQLSVATTEHNIAHVRDLISAGDALFQQRRRIIQARYRRKKVNSEKALVQDNQMLRDEIVRLELRRLLIISGALGNTTCWSVAAEYFRRFRNGYERPVTLQVPGTTHEVPATSHTLQTHIQSDFLQSVMASDMISNDCPGVDELLARWKQVALIHPGICFKIVHLEYSGDDSVVATVKAFTTVSKSTLCYAFPHLINSDGECSLLGSKLLGQELVIHGTQCFVWDDEAGRVVGMDYQADMMTPLLRLLKSLENVSHVLDSALLAPAYDFL